MKDILFGALLLMPFLLTIIQMCHESGWKKGLKDVGAIVIVCGMAVAGGILLIRGME